MHSCVFLCVKKNCISIWFLRLPHRHQHEPSFKFSVSLSGRMGGILIKLEFLVAVLAQIVDYFAYMSERGLGFDVLAVQGNEYTLRGFVGY